MQPIASPSCTTTTAGQKWLGSI